MMLIKHMIAVNADCHGIISKISGKMKEIFLHNLKYSSYPVTLSARYFIYIEIGLSNYSVIPVAQLFHETSAIFAKTKY